MSSFLRNLTISFNARENAIKENLISTLNENAKEIQFECKEQDSGNFSFRFVAGVIDNGFLFLFYIFATQTLWD